MIIIIIEMIWIMILMGLWYLMDSGVQTAVARRDEDGVRKPSEVRDHLLQEVPWILRDGRRWGQIFLFL